jgi:hypothetical protein
MSNKKGKLLHSNNFFDSATKNSDKKLNVLVTDFNDKLVADTTTPALFAAYTTVFKPNYMQFQTAYGAQLNAENRYKNRTENAENLWEQLRKNADEWSFQVESTPGGAFRRGTLNYNAIFPNGYAPLQVSNYEGRIRALKSMIDIAALYTDLAAVTIDMTNFYQTLLAARSEQQGFEFGVTTARVNLDTARANMVNAMFRMYAFLTYTFAPDMDKVESYFDVSIVRSSSRNTSEADALPVLNIDILPMARRTAISRSFADAIDIEISNIGNESVAIWTTNNENSAEPIGVVLLGAGDTFTYDSDSLSDGSNDLKYLIISNKGATEKAKVAITVL